VADNAGEARFGQKWLLIAGVAILVLGVGYFLKYAFDRDWVGPAGRVALAYAGGLACLGAGELFRRRELYRYFGFALMGGGIAILYFAGFAAFQWYHLVGQPVAFGLLVLVTLLAGLLSYAHDAQWLAVLGLTGGFSTPILLGTGVDSQVALMTYMAILNLAALGLARVRSWILPGLLAFGFTWLVFTGWFVRFYGDHKFWLTTFYLNLFYLIHFLAPVAHGLRRGGPLPFLTFAAVLPNAFIAAGYTLRITSPAENAGLATLAYALAATAMASWLFRRRAADRRPFVLLLAQGLLFLILTVPVVFSGTWITAFWAAQAGLLMWASGRLGGARLGAAATGLLALPLAKLFLLDYVSEFGMGANLVYRPAFTAGLPGRWITVAIALAALALSARWLPAALRAFRAGFLGLFAVLLLAALSLETRAFFGERAPEARFAALSVLWGLYAVSLLATGFRRQSGAARKAGLGLLGVTVIKIFLVDMAHVGTPFRIVSFLGLGALLIGASFLYYRYRDRLTRFPASGPPPDKPQEGNP